MYVMFLPLRRLLILQLLFVVIAHLRWESIGIVHTFEMLAAATVSSFCQMRLFSNIYNDNYFAILRRVKTERNPRPNIFRNISGYSADFKNKQDITHR